MRRQAKDWEEILVKDILDKEPLSKIYIKLLKFYLRKQTKKMSKRYEQKLYQKRYANGNKHIKRCSASCH